VWKNNDLRRSKPLATITISMIQKGFTIVEVIIVVAVIGILASIVIVSYNGIQNNAHDTAVQSDLENITGQLEAYRTQSTNVNQEFPGNAAQLLTVGFKLNKDSYDTSLAVNLAYCTDSTRQQFAVAAASKSGNVYLVTEDGFRSHSLTTASFTTSICNSLGLLPVAYGYASGAWQL
jgi:type IV pilus assembly protein PilA